MGKIVLEVTASHDHSCRAILEADDEMTSGGGCREPTAIDSIIAYDLLVKAVVGYRRHAVEAQLLVHPSRALANPVLDAFYLVLVGGLVEHDPCGVVALLCAATVEQGGDGVDGGL